MRILGVDPGSVRTGYGCIDSDGSCHQLITCGALIPKPRKPFPEKLLSIRKGLSALFDEHRPDVVAVEDLFFARNVRSVLKLGHVRGVILLAAAEAGVKVFEYSPTAVKLSVVGYGQADKYQVQQMITQLLRLAEAPTPLDVSDALAVAVCHSHTCGPGADKNTMSRPRARRTGSLRRFGHGVKSSR